MLHIKDNASERNATAVVSIPARRAIKNLYELPTKIRNLFRPVRRRYLYPDKPKWTTAKTISVSEDGIALMEGGYSTIDKGTYKYWVSLFSQDRRPVHYDKHVWTPVAITHSSETGLCASADKFGQIHVWRARDGEQTNLFKPVNQHFHHVEWMPDESGVYLATKPFGSKSNRKYTFNQYGNISHSFSFQNWSWKPADNVRTDFVTEPSIRDRRTGRTYRLENSRPMGDVVVKTRSNEFKLFSEVAKDLGKYVVGKWGSPTCYNFISSPTDGRLPLIVGTDKGFLLQFAIDNLNGRDRPRLTRNFLSHEAQISSISESPSGKLLASTSLDGTVRVWRMDPVRTLADVGFVTDGTRIIELGKDRDSGVRIGDGMKLFDGGPYYERIQKIQRGDYQPGNLVDIRIVRNAGTRKERELTYQIQLVASADIAEPVLNFFSTKKEAWITWTKNGFYNASPDGSRHVGWHVNQGRTKAAEFSKVEQFRDDLYRPDLVELVAKNWQSVNTMLEQPASPSTVDASPSTNNPTLNQNQVSLVSVLESTGASEALENSPNTYEKYEKVRPPRIKIQHPYGTTSTRDEEIDVEFIVETPLSLPITDLIVFNNGRDQRIMPKTVGKKRRDGILTTSYVSTVRLDAGANNISLKAKHASAYSNIAEVTVEHRSRKKIDQSLPKLYILAVGISDYEDDDLDLNYADKDAEDFVAAWKRQLGRRYSSVDAKIIPNQEATIDGMEDGFDWLSSQEVTAKDFVFVFLAGHALFNEDDVWVFGSTNLNPNRLTRTGITDGRINRLLEKELRDAGTVILFLDTCHAGGVKSNTRGRRVNRYHSQRKDIWLDSERHVFASCTQHEVSLENPMWENGAFTEGLLKAMDCEKCDVDGNGFISIEELKIKTGEFVRKLTNHKQSPTGSGQSLNRGVTELIEVRQ